MANKAGSGATDHIHDSPTGGVKRHIDEYVETDGVEGRGGTVPTHSFSSRVGDGPGS